MLNELVEEFDKVALEYDFMATLFHKPDFFLANLSAKHGMALDIGCGSGLLVKALSEYYGYVIGIDISESLLSIAKKTRSSSKSSFICMDAQHLGLNLKFDLIVSQNTFHHIEDIPALLTQLKKYLTPKGKIILTDVTSDNPTPATWVYIVGATQEFVPNILRYGLSVALRIFRFRISKHWLKHLANDVYLSPKEFRELYSKYLPNCQFYGSGTVIWEKINEDN